jgi:magnesium chelatase subunit I
MHAQIGTVKDPELRVQIVAERSTFDEDPASACLGGFCGVV